MLPVTNSAVDDMSDSTNDNQPYVAIGKIVRARGVQGELVVVTLTDFPERFETMTSVLIEQAQDGRIVEFKIAALRSFRNQFLLQLKGIDSRNDAVTLVGSYLCVPRDELVELPDDSYYQFELVGMEVVTTSGEIVGEVVEIMSFPANDVWRVEGEKEILLPAIKDVVKRVDTKTRKITVELIPGLIPEAPAGKKSKD